MKEYWEYFVKNMKIVIADLRSNDKERKRKQIPNTLTIIRGFLAPFTIIPAVLNKNLYLAFALIAICGLTDCFDGWYARKYNAQSEFGADLDAICDKLFVLTLTFPLAFEYTSWIILILILELTIALINSLYRIKGIDARSSIIGKVKTVVLDCSIGLCYFDYLIHIPDIALTIVTVLTNIMQLITIVDYILKYRQERINKTQLNNV